jgi:hypothetical protein
VAGIVVVVDEVVVDVVAGVIVVPAEASSVELLHAAATSETAASKIPMRWVAWFRRLGIRTSPARVAVGCRQTPASNTN